MLKLYTELFLFTRLFVSSSLRLFVSSYPYATALSSTRLAPPNPKKEPFSINPLRFMRPSWAGTRWPSLRHSVSRTAMTGNERKSELPSKRAPWSASNDASNVIHTSVNPFTDVDDDAEEAEEAEEDAEDDVKPRSSFRSFLGSSRVASLPSSPPPRTPLGHRNPDSAANGSANGSATGFIGDDEGGTTAPIPPDRTGCTGRTGLYGCTTLSTSPLPDR